MAQWYEAAYFTMAEVGVQVQIPAGQLAVFFCFFSFSFFLQGIFALWLVSVYSLFPFLASRDFWENVFLVQY